MNTTKPENHRLNRQIEEIINRYSRPVPRYTSYPTVVQWQKDAPDSLLHEAFDLLNNEPVSLYFHIPFCEARCHFCGCNVVLNRRREMVDRFMQTLKEEVRQKVGERKIRVHALHFGGGTPNTLKTSDWDDLIDFLEDYFIFEEGFEASIECDPMLLTEDYLSHLRNLGFNRISLGVQDVNNPTLGAVNRPQEAEHLDEIVSFARSLGFKSINLDFIYGLPFQTAESMANNIDFILRHRVDRVAFYSFAFMPSLKRNQSKIKEKDLPDYDQKVAFYLQVRESLRDAGYESIGMDHFALPSDNLYRALQQKRLYRNFMGYTDVYGDFIGFGPSAISSLNGRFFQNHPGLRRYEQSVSENSSWFEKGYQMNHEDVIRSEIILQIMGNFRLDIESIEKKFSLNFSEHFAAELERLEEFTAGGLLSITPDAVEIYELGFYAVRHIASVFDQYMVHAPGSFSKGI